MTVKTVMSKMSKGDTFSYSGKPQMLIDFSLSDCSLTTSYPKMYCALDLQTYKIVCFCEDWEVELKDIKV